MVQKSDAGGGRGAKEPRRQGWTKSESIIALVSVVFAAAGVVVSAVSTVFTYQQLRLLSRERATPYRAILYSAKVDSYKDFVAAATRAEAALGRMILSNYQDSGHDLPGTRPAMTEAVERSEQQLAAFLEVATQSRALWPDAISSRIAQAAEISSAGDLCTHAFSELRRGSATYERAVQVCDGGQLLRATNEFRDLAAEIMGMMRQNLRADQLQAIEAD